MMNTVAIDDPGLPPARQPGLAMWRQIATSLEQQIAAGQRPPGTRLPAETQLASQFRVNRHTVRRALEELSRNGLVRVEQGRGTFVTRDVLDYTVGPRTRFSEWIRRNNKEPSGEVLRLVQLAAGPPIAAALGIPPASPIILLERLGFADNHPVSLATHHFPAIPGLHDALAAAPSITAALKSAGIPDYRRKTTRVTARLPTPQECDLLRTAPNRPLLIAENTNTDRTGQIIEFGIARYPTPRVQIVFEP